MQLRLGPLLKNLGIRQARLAELADLTPGYVSALVSGKKEPSPKTLQRIAEALEVDIPALYAGKMVATSEVAPGFAEDEARFVAKPEGERQQASNTFQYLTATTAVPSLNILKGDVLHTNLHSQAQTRGMAIVTRSDNTTGNAVTLIRQVEGDTVLPVTPGQPPEPFSSDSYEYAVMGWVTQIERRFDTG